MRDVILALVALAGFLVFVGILVWQVPEPDLLTVVAIVALFVVFDFARELFGRRS